MPTDHAALARKRLAEALDHPSDDPDGAILIAQVGTGHALLACSAQLNGIRAELATLNDHARKDRR